MKAIQGFVGVGLCFLSLGVAEAQTGSKCSANVTKRSFEASTRLERAWDIQFDVTVNECAASGCSNRWRGFARRRPHAASN